MNQYIKIQQIADDIAEHPLLRDIPFDRIVNYALECMRKIGCTSIFEQKVAPVDVKDYQGKLPCDFVEVLSVAGCNGREYVTSEDMFFIGDPCRKPEKCCYVGAISVKQRQVTEGCGSYIEKKVTAYAPNEQLGGLGAYKIQGDNIFIDVPHDVLKVSYTAFVMDEDGWPMIPNNEALKHAIEAYIEVNRFRILFAQGKISRDVYQDSQQEYAWAVGQASNDLTLPSIDEMETFSHTWNTLIPRVTEHRNGFATAHIREHLKRH